MGIDSWFKKGPNKKDMTMSERVAHDAKQQIKAEKVAFVAGATAAAAIGAAGGQAMYAHEVHGDLNAQMPNFDTMPVDAENPTQGMKPTDAPKPITIARPEGASQAPNPLLSGEEWEKMTPQERAGRLALLKEVDEYNNRHSQIPRPQNNETN